MLIQAEPRRAGVETLDVERVRAELITNHRIPAEAIIIATGEERGLTRVEAEFKLGLADPACPVTFVITQKALAEGWDCPFAYCLVSMASLHSATAVEQLLGRILRQPGASHRVHRPLNQSYAFVVSTQLCRDRGGAARAPGGRCRVRAARGPGVRNRRAGTSRRGSTWMGTRGAWWCGRWWLH